MVYSECFYGVIFRYPILTMAILSKMLFSFIHFTLRPLQTFFNEVFRRMSAERTQPFLRHNLFVFLNIKLNRPFHIKCIVFFWRYKHSNLTLKIRKTNFCRIYFRIKSECKIPDTRFSFETNRGFGNSERKRELNCFAVFSFFSGKKESILLWSFRPFFLSQRVNPIKVI